MGDPEAFRALHRRREDRDLASEFLERIRSH
jgi:hypothetical protein